MSQFRDPWISAPTGPGSSESSAKGWRASAAKRHPAMNANPKRQGRKALSLVRKSLFKLLHGIVLIFVMPVFGLALLIGIMQMLILASLSAAIVLLDD